MLFLFSQALPGLHGMKKRQDDYCCTPPDQCKMQKQVHEPFDKIQKQVRKIVLQRSFSPAIVYFKVDFSKQPDWCKSPGNSEFFPPCH
jgi:hypothetical protein